MKTLDRRSRSGSVTPDMACMGTCIQELDLQVAGIFSLQSRDVATPELMYLYPGVSPASTDRQASRNNYIDNETI